MHHLQAACQSFFCDVMMARLWAHVMKLGRRSLRRAVEKPAPPSRSRCSLMAEHMPATFVLLLALPAASQVWLA